LSGHLNLPNGNTKRIDNNIRSSASHNKLMKSGQNQQLVHTEESNKIESSFRQMSAVRQAGRITHLNNFRRGIKFTKTNRPDIWGIRRESKLIVLFNFQHVSWSEI
jgi:hypothetical protein